MLTNATCLDAVDCWDRCNGEPYCMGFSLSRHGCYVYDKICDTPVMQDGYAFDFNFGLSE